MFTVAKNQKRLSLKGLSKKPKKIECEICGENNKKVLQLHHIVERTELNTDNSWWNLACICANCHNLHHAKEIEILSLYPATKPPYGRILVYKKNGVLNVPNLDDKYYTPQPKSMKYFGNDKD